MRSLGDPATADVRAAVSSVPLQLAGTLVVGAMLIHHLSNANSDEVWVWPVLLALAVFLSLW